MLLYHTNRLFCLQSGTKKLHQLPGSLQSGADFFQLHIDANAVAALCNATMPHRLIIVYVFSSLI